MTFTLEELINQQNIFNDYLKMFSANAGDFSSDEEKFIFLAKKAVESDKLVEEEKNLVNCNLFREAVLNCGLSSLYKIALYIFNKNNSKTEYEVIDDALMLSSKNLNKIPNDLPSVEELYLNNNNISKIENLSDDLELLSINDNNISVIENLPSSLKTLEISGNPIERIVSIPKTLEELHIDEDKVYLLTNDLLNENLSIYY